MIGNRTVSLQLSVNWLIGIGVVGAVLIGLFIFGPTSWHSNLVFSAAVLAGCAGLTTAINNLDQRVAQRDQQQAQARHERVAAALEFAYCWNSPTMHHCKKAGREIIKKWQTLPNVAAQIEYLHEDPTRHGNLVDVINWFEALGIAIDQNVIDDDTARRFFRAVVIEYWHTTEGFVRKRRAERNNARLLDEFEALYNRWKA